MTKSNSAIRRGFTLIELVIAGMLAALILAAVTFSLSQLGRARNMARDRVEAYQRAATAIDAIRTDVVSLIRSDDLFDCRFLLQLGNTRARSYDRSELLVFNSSLRPIREVEYQGEGLEYETAYRVEDDELGSALWRRRDPVPDEHPDGGGIAEPVADGVVGVRIEASDGLGSWREEWDSDYDGLPTMVRITVTASGAEVGTEPTDSTPEVTLRTVVALPRMVPPKPDELPKEDAAAAAAADPAAAAAAAGATPTGGGAEAPAVEITLPPGGGRPSGSPGVGRPNSPSLPSGGGRGSGVRGGGRGVGGGRGPVPASGGGAR